MEADVSDDAGKTSTAVALSCAEAAAVVDLLAALAAQRAGRADGTAGREEILALAVDAAGARALDALERAATAWAAGESVARLEVEDRLMGALSARDLPEDVP